MDMILSWIRPVLSVIGITYKATARVAPGGFRRCISILLNFETFKLFKKIKWRSAYPYPGALDGGSPCRVSILRNANVACLLFISMSHVELKKCPCHMSNLRNSPVACQ